MDDVSLCRSFNYTDEMCWGSMWLYKATGEDKYLTEAKKWFDGSPDWGMSWDDKIVGCQVVLCHSLHHFIIDVIFNVLGVTYH